MKDDGAVGAFSLHVDFIIENIRDLSLQDLRSLSKLISFAQGPVALQMKRKQLSATQGTFPVKTGAA